MFLKGFITAVIFGLSLTSATIVFAQSDLSMTLDSHVINSDVPPFIENDRTMVPVRFISEAFGADVYWNEEARLVTIAKDHGVLIQLTIGSNTMEIVYSNRPEFIPGNDGVMVENTSRIDPFGLDVAAVIRGGRTFVPVRSIAEALGILTSWDAESRTVLFTTLVLDDFPDGIVFLEQHQFSGDYSNGLSPREAALKFLSFQMLRLRQSAEHYERLEGRPAPAPEMPTYIILVDSDLWQGVYHYEFVWSDDDTVYYHLPTFRMSLDGALYMSAGRGLFMRIFLNDWWLEMELGSPF